MVLRIYLAELGTALGAMWFGDDSGSLCSIWAHGAGVRPSPVIVQLTQHQLTSRLVSVQ